MDSYFKNSRKIKKRCFKQDTATFIRRNSVNSLIVYELVAWPKSLSTDFTLDDCLLGLVKLTKNVDPNKYGDSGSGIGFDACSEL